jgi:hypothetical protein
MVLNTIQFVVRLKALSGPVWYQSITLKAFFSAIPSTFPVKRESHQKVKNRTRSSTGEIHVNRHGYTTVAEARKTGVTRMRSLLEAGKMPTVMM